AAQRGSRRHRRPDRLGGRACLRHPVGACAGRWLPRRTGDDGRGDVRILDGRQRRQGVPLRRRHGPGQPGAAGGGQGHAHRAGAPDGSGYWMVAADGGVFSFGTPFWGSTGNLKLNKPVEGIVPTLTNEGYWLVASDGGVFAFGDAGFRGSMGSTKLNKPVVGL